MYATKQRVLEFEEARRFVAVLHGRALAALEAQAASTQEGEQGEGGRPGAGGDARPDREEGACSLREVAEAVVVVAAQWEGAGRRLGVRLLPHIESDLAALIKAAAAARIDALGCGIARQAEEELRRGLAAADAEADAPADVLSASAGGLGAALRSSASDLGPLMDDEMRCHAGAAMAEALPDDLGVFAAAFSFLAASSLAFAFAIISATPIFGCARRRSEVH